jgi:hypothetical protein
VNGRIKLAALVAALLALAVLAGRAAPAQAASPDAKKIAALTKKVNALTKQVKTLQTQMTQTRRVIVVNFAAETCLAAMTADLIQGTWGVIDQIAQAAQGKTYFGQQTPANDYKNCSFLSQPSVPRPGATVPPSLRILDPLLAWLHVE